MKRYDCSKVLDYIHERNRLCGYESCHGCPFDYLKDCQTMDIDQSMIDTLQKWSDEHPEKTRAEVFLERVPTCTKVMKIIGGERLWVCWAIVSGTEEPSWCGSYDDTDWCASPCDPCTKCWNMPYNGEFEKEVPE